MMSLPVLTIVFMNDHLKMEASAAYAVFGTALVLAIPSALLAKRAMDRHGARRTFFATVAATGLVELSAPLVLCGPSCARGIYVYGCAAGVSLGFYFSSNTAVFACLVPPGSDAQFMSLYYFAGTVITWAPPAVYAVAHQLTRDTAAALVVVGGFLLASLPAFAHMGDGAAHAPEDKLAAAELTSPVVEDLDPAECALQIAAYS